VIETSGSRESTMGLSARIALLGLLALCAVGLSTAADRPEPTDDERQMERLKKGLLPDPERASPEQLRKLLGNPRRVSRQILYQRYIEQWTYDRPPALRLEFDCRTGQLPRLVSVSFPAAR
jgi:hypothetical protein